MLEVGESLMSGEMRGEPPRLQRYAIVNVALNLDYYRCHPYGRVSLEAHNSYFGVDLCCLLDLSEDS